MWWMITIIILMNGAWISLLLLSPVLRILSNRQLNADKYLDIKGNCSTGRIKRTLLSKIKLYLASYHTRFAINYIGTIPSHRIRNFFYKYVYLVNMAKNAVIYHNVEFRSPWNLIIGEGTIIGDNAILDASRGIRLGKNVNISSHASFYSLQHDYRDLNFDCTKDNSGSIIVEDRAWIGPQVIVLPNVRIGEGSVIAGGAVVTQDIPPFEIWGGIPAKKIGERPKNINYTFNGFHPHFL